MVTGYLHERYAEALAEWGQPRSLPASKGWVLERPIGAEECQDAMHCYPLFACRNWPALETDLEHVGRSLVSVTVVTDPFAPVGEDDLRKIFRDVVRPFKRHMVVDLQERPESFIHPHHLRNVRKAAAVVRVRYGAPSAALLDAWIGLYAHLVARHRIGGMVAFSANSFALQFQVPGLVVGWAESEGEIVGMLLWFMMGECAYYHLGAYSAAGYASRCSFALFHAAIEHFAAAGLRWLNMGAGAGASDDGSGGLTRFKRGWATGTRVAYLCGRVFDPDRYHRIRQARGIPDDALGSGRAHGYFPAYRRGEFA